MISPPDQKTFRNKQFSGVQCVLLKLGNAIFTFQTWYAKLASFKGQLQSILLVQCFSINYIRLILLPIKRHHQTSCSEWLCLVAMLLPPHMPLECQKLHFPSKSILIFCRANGTLHAGCREIEEALEKGFLWPHKKTLSKL